MRKVLCGTFLAFLANSVVAWDGSVSGKIGMIEVTGTANYGFRVFLKGTSETGAPSLCGNDKKWAYLNGSDSNYSVYVSALLAAKAAQQTVSIYSNRQNGTVDGYCHIGHIQVH